MSETVERRLGRLLTPAVTDRREDALTAVPVTLLAAHEDEARLLGIDFVGGPEVTIALTDPARPLGRVRVQAGGHRNILFFDNRSWGGAFHADIRIAGDDSSLLFNDIGSEYVCLPDVYLRTSEQFLFWGGGASAVGCRIEIDGRGQGVVVGDDALISGGVWIRNYDMHAVHDLATGQRINPPPDDLVLERHVWLGQDALLLNCQRIGMGSIIGARSLVKRVIPATAIAAGTPARVIREGASWGRHPYAMTGAERRALGLSELPGT